MKQIILILVFSALLIKGKAQSSNNLIFYPDPFVNQVTIRHLSAPANLKAIVLYDILGRKVLETDFNGNALANETINTSQFATGIYVIKLFYSDKTITQKMMKMSK